MSTTNKIKRVGINMPIKLYDKLMLQCEEKGLNPTSLMIFYLEAQSNQKDMIELLSEYLPIIKEIKDSQLKDKNEE